MTLAPLMSSAKMDWQTPECVLERVRQVDKIACDPCSCEGNPTLADWYYDEAMDGLAQEWPPMSDGYGLCYVNPPYGGALPKWVAKCVAEADRGCEIVLLVPARVETRWFRLIWDTAQAVCFWRGRLTFKGAPSVAPFPSALAYWGPRPFRFAAAFESAGKVLVMR